MNFSLAHEISHILFHKSIEVPVDNYIPGFLWKNWIPPNEIPEFFAYKFAEFFLIPYEVVYILVKNWPQFDYQHAQNLLESGYTTREVLANAMVDVLYTLGAGSFTKNDSDIQELESVNDNKYNDIYYNTILLPYQKGISYQSVLKSIFNLKSRNNNDNFFRFLYDSSNSIRAIIANERPNFSEEIFNYILRTLGYGS
jgi:hypothetical protein